MPAGKGGWMSKERNMRGKEKLEKEKRRKITEKRNIEVKSVK